VALLSYGVFDSVRSSNTKRSEVYLSRFSGENTVGDREQAHDPTNLIWETIETFIGRISSVAGGKLSNSLSY
jgi:hypothetical protein